MRNFQDNAVLGRRRGVADFVEVEKESILSVVKNPEEVGVSLWSRP
jgi:hypothetical protein